MNFLVLILAVIIATLFGWVISSPFLRAMTVGERVSLSFIFGLGAITLIIFSLELLGIKYSLVSVLFLPFFLIFGWLVFHCPRISFLKLKDLVLKTLKTVRNFSVLEKLLLALLVFLVAVNLLRSLYWPVFYWDALAAYDARAKFLFFDRSMVQVAQKMSEPFHSYPPFTSLAHLYFYLFGADNPQIIYSLFYLTLLVTFYYSAREKILRFWSLILTAILGSSPFIMEFAANAYTHLPYTVFLGMGTIYLVRFFGSQRKELFWSAIFLLTFSLWTRPAGEWNIVFTSILTAFFVLTKRKYFREFFVFLVLASLIWYVWPWYLRTHLGYKIFYASLSGQALTDILQGIRGGEVDLAKFTLFGKLFWENFKRGIEPIFYPVFLIILLTFWHEFKKQSYLLILILGFIFILLFGSFRSLFAWPDWQNLLSNSLHRQVMPLIPLLIFYISRLKILKEIKK